MMEKGLIQGEWKYYDDSLGYLKKIVNYKNDLNHGIYKEFYPNGNIKKTGYYDRNFIKTEVSIEGFTKTYSLPIGSWDYFDENNNLIKTIVYDCNGNIIKTLPEK